VSSKSSRRWWWFATGVVVLALGLGLAWAWQGYQRFATTPLTVQDAQATFDVERGTSFKGIVGGLRARGLTRAAPLWWRLLAREMRVAGKLHAGEYALVPGITPRALLADMAAGRVVQHHFTIVDGWTFAQLRAALAAEPGLVQRADMLDDAALMRALGAPGEAPEGRFLPETYAWVKGDADLDVLRRAHRAMQDTLDALWPDRAPGLPLASPYQALILASIVEKETGRADERAAIAGVFTRRLERGMLLQTDPSVIYGMGPAYAGNIRKRDLETDTPFNTYTRAGLPPTPIALPGKPALVAALHPAAGDALYFVARGDGSGSHVFSATLDAHNRAVDCHQRKRCR